MYRFVIIFFIVLFFIGCSTQEPIQHPITQTPKHIKHVTHISKVPQNPSRYIYNLPMVPYRELLQKDMIFNKRFFRPWHIPQLSVSKEEAMWGFMYEHKETYGQNYRPIDEKWYERQKQNANFQAFNTVDKKAIMIKNTNMRVFPTISPIFYDPTEAGEGFPFDYNQLSSIYINTPVLVSHFSKDRAWAFIESNFSTGWVPVDSIAYLNTKRRRIFENENYAIAVKDNFPLYKNGHFIQYIKLGTIFPKYRKKLFIVTRTSANLEGILTLVSNKNIISKPLRFGKTNVLNALHELENEPYGWGGLLGTRDCSSMTRDFFSLFGIYLERNSRAQTYSGKYISLHNMSLEQKKKTILLQGKPFLTLIYLKGHILLYVGPLKNEPIVFHETWGVQTKDKNGKEGRKIIGKTIFSTLELGKDIKNFDPDASLISKAQGLVILNNL